MRFEMANISGYDPFDFTVEPFDDLFRGFFRPVRSATNGDTLAPAFQSV